MKNVFDKIYELDNLPFYSKHEQFVNGIMNAIDEKIVGEGDSLPSVNTMMSKLGFARETVMKGYRDLKNRGIVESKNRLGFFVSHTNTQQKMKVALLMYAMDTFQEQLYSSFRNELGSDVHVDVFFHHGNIEVFETIMSMIRSKYGKYVVSPIPHPRTKELLNTLPRDKFLMIDRYEKLDGEFSHITQEFAESSYNAFMQLAPAIKKFKEIIFFQEPELPIPQEPAEIRRSFLKFIKDTHINGKVQSVYKPGSIQKGKVYYTNDNTELWQIIKDSIDKGLVPGKDIGILSHNDEPVKELICGGITTYSTDFALMGKKAAQAILNKRTAVQEVIPTTLIRRASI